MTFDETLPLIQDGKAVFSESLGVTMFHKNEVDRLTFVPRQRNKRMPFIDSNTWVRASAMASDWVLSGIEPKGEAA